MHEEIKQKVLVGVSGGSPFHHLGRANSIACQPKIHVRFCSRQTSDGQQFRFNINSNTLQNDWEVWICGDDLSYYLIPIAIIKGIYDDPSGYRDRTHPDIRVVTVRTNMHKVVFARGGKHIDLRPYWRTRLPGSTKQTTG